MGNGPNTVKWRIITALTWGGGAVLGGVFWALLASTVFGQTVITNDRGGEVSAYAAQVAATTGQVEVRGQCMSACTLWLALGDRVCTSRSAVWGFHGATARTPALASIIEPYTNQQLADAYPPVVRKKFTTRWVKLRAPEIQLVSGAQMIRMGVKECPR